MSQFIVNGTSFEDQDDTGSSVPRMSQNRRDPAPAQSVAEHLAEDYLLIIDPYEPCKHGHGLVVVGSL